MTTYLFFGKEPKEVAHFMIIFMSVSDMYSENWLNAGNYDNIKLQKYSYALYNILTSKFRTLELYHNISLL